MMQTPSAINVVLLNIQEEDIHWDDTNDFIWNNKCL
jgi:hypothetical protein